MDERLGDEMEDELPDVEVKQIVDGLGFGTGLISAEAVESEPGNEDLARVTDAALNSPQILTKVDIDPETNEPVQDDGCGDGRSVNSAPGAITKGAQELRRSLNRPKVFGGGATMTAASRVGLGIGGASLETTFSDAMNYLDARGLDFGAHTDNHTHGENCGCGAIDKSPLILQAASDNWNDITNAIDALGVSTDGLTDVLDKFHDYASRTTNQPYSGRKVMDKIIEKEKVVKELADDHLETRIVLNTVRGYTIDQEYIRDATDGRAQVFAVDVWRLEDLSNNLYPGQPEEQQKAFLSMLVYTLATAAVLTKGDLPVHIVSEREEQSSQENVS